MKSALHAGTLAAASFFLIVGSVFALSFKADLNYPDGSTVQAGAVIHKGWVLTNGSDSPVAAHAMPVYANGGIHGVKSLWVPAVAAHGTVTVHATVTMPKATGHYRIVWGTSNGLYLDVVAVRGRMSPEEALYQQAYDPSVLRSLSSQENQVQSTPKPGQH